MKIANFYAFILFFAGCGGNPTPSHPTIQIDTVFGNCFQTPCDPSIQTYELAQSTWVVEIPTSLEDLAYGPNEGTYKPNTNTYNFTITGEDFEIDSKDKDVTIIVNNCDNDMCSFKNDYVVFELNDNGIFYGVVFYGTSEVQLSSDKIPDIHTLLKMSVVVEIHLDGARNYVNNEGLDTKIADISR